MKKFFDELRTNLDVESVAAEAAAAVAEQDSTATRLSDDDFSQIAGENLRHFSTFLFWKFKVQRRERTVYSFSQS